MSSLGKVRELAGSGVVEGWVPSLVIFRKGRNGLSKGARPD